MATRQGIDTRVLTALTETETFPFIAIKAQFDTSTVRLWTGKDDITLNSETYLGAGTALSFGGEWHIHDKDAIQTSFPSFLKIINMFIK